MADLINPGEVQLVNGAALIIMNFTEVLKSSFTWRAFINVNSGQKEKGNMWRSTFSLSHTYTEKGWKGEDGAG